MSLSDEGYSRNMCHQHIKYNCHAVHLMVDINQSIKTC